MEASHCSTVCDSHQHPQLPLHILPSWAPFLDSPAPSRLMRMPLCIFTLSHPPHFLPPTSAPCSLFCAILGRDSTDLLHQSDCDHRTTEIFNQAPGAHGKSACCRKPPQSLLACAFCTSTKSMGGCVQSCSLVTIKALLASGAGEEGANTVDSKTSQGGELLLVLGNTHGQNHSGSYCRDAPGCKRLWVCPHHCGAPVRGAAGTCP